MKLLASLFAATTMGLSVAPASAAKLDAGLYTLYSVSKQGRIVSYLVCGNLPQTEGCYGSGNLGSLDRACAVMEGKPHQKGNVITRDIYVFDKRSSSSDPAVVNVYVRKDTITDSADSIQVKLKEQIPTGNFGAPNANCFMAGSDSLIYVGTDASQVTTRITTVRSKVSQIVGQTNVKYITADQRGFVTVSFLDGNFFTVGPDGGGGIGGGGSYQMANTRNAFTTNGSRAPPNAKK